MDVHHRRTSPPDPGRAPIGWVPGRWLHMATQDLDVTDDEGPDADVEVTIATTRFAGIPA